MDTDDDDTLPEGPSKSQRKRESTALQALGEALVALPHDRFNKVELPDALRDAVREARRIRQHGALRRQLQYIGKVMRSVDPEPIRAQLAAFEGQSHEHTAWLHRLERWRERLLDDDQALARLVDEHPDTDAQRLHTLLRNARRERAEHKPPRAYREIFQILRTLIPEPRPDTAARAVPDAGDPDIDDHDEHVSP